jgi:hypothetical protein
MNLLLGPEAFKFWLLDRRSCFNVSFCARLSGRVDVDELRRALAAVTACHPLLRVRIVEQAGRPRFVDADRPVAFTAARREHEDDWRSACEAAIARRFPADAPPLALQWLETEGGGDLILTALHALADSRSLLIIYRDLLLALSGEPLSARPAPPVFEELISPASYPTADGPGQMQQWWSRKTAALFQELDLDVVVATLAPLGPTRFRHARFDARATQRLLARCRNAGTTVHGPISAAFLTELASDRGDAADLLCQHAVDLRPYLEPAVDDDVGLCLSHVVTRHRIESAENLWPLAQAVRDQMISAIEQGQHIDQMLATVRRFLSHDRSPPHVGELTVSNAGRFDAAPQIGGREITEFMGVASVGSAAPVVAFFQMRGELSLVFSYPENWRSPVVVERCWRGALSRLREAAL